MKSIVTWIQKNDQNILMFFTMFLSIAAFTYFYREGTITAYGDSRAHLNISRRVVDSLTPGIAQLGGAWLPLLHVLMLPTIWVDYLWRSGISGSIVNMLAYITGMAVLYKLLFEITLSRTRALIGFIIVALNINILYFQVTPMTEVLFISLFIIGIYFLYMWGKKFQMIHLISAGFFLCLASLVRYEGWFVTIAALLLVAGMSYIKLGKSKTEANLLLFGSVACFGIFLWLLWQFVIFGHPFDFLRSEFAAGVNTQRDIEAGLVPTYKNLYVSVLTEMYASFHTSGIIVSVLGFASILFFIVKKNIKILSSPESILLLGIIPFLFEILVVYKGNVPVYVPEIIVGESTRTFFNVRYALYFLPVFSFFIMLYTKNKIVLVAIFILVIVNQLTLLPLQGQTDILAFKDKGNLLGRENVDAINWFNSNYDSGLVLVSVGSSDSSIYKANLRMDKFISEGSGKYWDESLKKPDKYARWVIIQDSSRDSLVRHINHDRLDNEFNLVAEINGTRYYKRKE